VTEPGYQVLAWGPQGVQTGRLIEDGLELNEPVRDLPLEDIRNCSSARDRGWGAVTGVNKHTRKQELWRFDLDGPASESIVSAEYLLHNAIDPSGRYVCYTAPPSHTRTDMSLYRYTAGTGTETIVEGSVSRFCCPSWQPSTVKVVYHTSDNEVVEVDTASRSHVALFRGEHPAVSPDGAAVAYREGNAIRIWSVADHSTRDVPMESGLWDRQILGAMTWSSDGKYLLIAQSAGVFGYELAFYRVEVNTGRRVEVPQRHLQGLRFG
jgi:hypothetical protein